MEKDTNEKSLMVVQDNFLTKIKKFFVRFFYGKDEEIEYDEAQENYNNQNADKEQDKDDEQKERKLYDFDADNPEEWPEPKEVFSDSEDSDDVDNEREQVSEACREKEELEQKLKNYYASITKINE